MVAAQWSVAVVVPARDEQSSVETALRSVQCALDRVDVLERTVVLVADRCRDDTVGAALRALQGADQVIEIDVGSAGAARAAGVEAALERTTAPLTNVWIASTDADSVVPSDWLARQLRHADAGMCAVAGTVELLHAPRYLRARFRATYRRGWHANATTHAHVHGANMGVRADVYRAVAGWTDLECGEDHDLWQRVVEFGYPTVSDTRLPVRTSTRRRGRAPGGFADDLARLALNGTPELP